MKREIIVIGASAGGVEAYLRLVAALPRDFSAAIFLVLHTSSETPNSLPGLLARHSNLPVVAAEDGAEIRPGRVVVAVPDYHLTLERGRMYLTHGPKQNRHRPSIDALFRSAATAYGSAVMRGAHRVAGRRRRRSCPHQAARRSSSGTTARRCHLYLHAAQRH